MMQFHTLQLSIQYIYSISNNIYITSYNIRATKYIYNVSDCDFISNFKRDFKLRKLTLIYPTY